MKNIVGIIGYGKHVETKLLPALKELNLYPKIILSNNIDLNLNIKFLRNFKELNIYKEISHLIISNIPSRHAKLIKKISNLNLPILVEKPILVNAEDYISLKTELNSRLVTEAMMYRYGNGINFFNKIIKKHKNFIDEINLIFTLPLKFTDLENTFRSDPMNRFNVIYEMGCYLYDLMWHLKIFNFEIKIKKVDMFKNNVLRILSGQINTIKADQKLNVNFMIGFNHKYQNDIELILKNKAYKIYPFFWGRAGDINYKIKNNDKTKYFKKYQHNSYKKIIFDWIHDNKSETIKDLQSGKRMKFILSKLIETENKVIDYV